MSRGSLQPAPTSNSDKTLLVNCLPAFIFGFVFLQEGRRAEAGPHQLFQAPRGAGHPRRLSPSACGAGFSADREA